MNRFRRVTSVPLLLLLAIIIFVPSFHASAAISCSASQSPSWQICGPIESLAGINEQSSLVQASDGTLRLAWTYITLSGTSSIDYATRLANGTWTASSQVTSLGGSNFFPSIVQLANGTIFLFWAYKATTSAHYQIYYRYLKGSLWSNYVPLPLQTSTTLNDTQASAAVGRDGTLWLFWARDNSTTTGTHVMRQLWYETLNSTGWSRREQSVTSAIDPNWNYEPSVIVGNDNVPRVAFSRGQNSLSNFQINYIQSSGSGWTSPRPIVNSNSTANDQNPSLVQDRNGTLWVFWTRDAVTNYVVRSEYSFDMGSTWRGETMLTAACSGCADSKYPSAVQSITDKDLWVLYSTNPTTGFSLYTLVTVNPVSPVHHVAISYSVGSYAANASEIYAGGFHNPYAFISQSPVLQFYVTVVNLGDFIENASVTMSATNRTSYSLGTAYVSVSIGGSSVAVFDWNTTNVKPAIYGFSANASVPNETLGNQAGGGLARTNIVHLLPVGDVDQDGSDTLTDVSFAYYNFGFGCSAPGICSPRYNPWADPSGLGSINIIDIGIISNNYDTFS